jgi:2-polyprenyl-3-methyl-5-hydroxy-6-metoxy-1,4-benzoquinol methylase
MSTSHVTLGSSAVQGELWGARAGDWAEVQEPAQSELYPPILDAAGVGAGTMLLDVGCGSGVAAGTARRRGAVVSGIDAALPLVELARARVTGSEFRVGELEALPYEDGSFDVVTGFNGSSTPPTRCARWARRIA